jgi:hypothetical protein
MLIHDCRVTHRLQNADHDSTLGLFTSGIGPPPKQATALYLDPLLQGHRRTCITHGVFTQDLNHILGELIAPKLAGKSWRGSGIFIPLND